MVEWLQFVANGLAVGSILLLGAVGLSLLYGVKRFANFAHGDFMTLGAYVAFTVSVTWGHDLLVAVLVAMLTVPLLGIALEWAVFDRLRARPATVALIASVGVSFVLQNIVRAVWGTQDLGYALQAETQVPLVGGAALTPLKLLLIVLAAATALGLHLLLTRTKLGLALRATADNYDLARVTGIPVRRVEYAAWALGGSLAALGGVCLAAVTLLNPNLGFQQLLLIFAAVLLGGVGSIYGAMLGAVVIGLAIEVSKPLLTEFAGLPSTLSPAVAFAILVLVLLLKPEGIAGTATKGRGLRRALPWRSARG